MVVEDIFNAAVEPLTHTIGWQAFAYGLLGRKTLKKTVRWIRRVFTRTNNDSEDRWQSLPQRDEDDPRNLYDKEK